MSKTRPRPLGLVVRMLALRSGAPGFKTRSNHSMNLFLVVPGFLTVVFVVVVVLFCRFVDCVSLALKSPYGKWLTKYVK